MAKRKHEDGNREDGEESQSSPPEVHSERTAPFRDFLNANLAQLRSQLSATEKGGQMIEPTLEAVHLQETLEYALALCDQYDVSEKADEMAVLAGELRGLADYVQSLLARRPAEFANMQERLARGEKVRTDGTLIIPPGWNTTVN